MVFLEKRLQIKADNPDWFIKPRGCFFGFDGIISHGEEEIRRRLSFGVLFLAGHLAIPLL